jgi:hypothetical protein
LINTDPMILASMGAEKHLEPAAVKLWSNRSKQEDANREIRVLQVVELKAFEHLTFRMP